MIAGFGAVGVLARYATDSVLANKTEIFPLSTFVINILGSFLIGALYVVGKEKGLISEATGLALGVGLLGGFTTFSAYSLQTVLMFEGKQMAKALIYLVGSPIAGFMAAYVGLAVARYLV